MKTASLSLLLSAWLLTASLPSKTGWAHASDGTVVLSKIKALQDKSNPERARIVRELGELGPRANAAIPALMDVLRDDRDLRKEAAWALGKIGSAAMPSLIKAVEDRDKAVQIAAIYGLQPAGANAKAAVPTLIKVLKTGDAPVRMAVVSVLGFIPGPQSVKALADQLVSDRDYAVRWRAAAALRALGPGAKEAAPALVKVFRELKDLQKGGQIPDVLNSEPPGWLDPVSDLETRVADALVEMGAPAVPILTALLKDPDKDLRVGILGILKDLGPEGKTAVPAIMKCLEDKEGEVRFMAARALGRLGPDALLSLPALRKTMGDSSAMARVEAAHTVLRLKPPADEAVAVLLEGMRDRDTQVRLLAMYAFRSLRLTEKRVVAVLLTASKDDDDESVRCEALVCLAAAGLPPGVVVDALQARFMDASEEVRATAAALLGRVKDSKLAVPPLLGALESPSARVRAAAAEALGRHGTAAASALTALTNAARDDPDDHVRDTAARALARIKE